jgi:geranylgeranyl pyrophosphate synthase
MQADLNAFFLLARQRCEQTLNTALQNLPAMPDRLTEAMRYSALAGGKRIRPCLTYAAADALGADLALADIPAAAIEMMHCYSLIHDDLPAMDNDDLRRGKPTVHKAFDEATAILAGDALQSLAFQILSEQQQFSDQTTRRMLCVLASAGGCNGMIAGQGIDLAAVGKGLSLSQLETMHQLKTGALISAAVELGALAAGCTDTSTLAALASYSRCIGLAFQVRDDILDVTSDTQTLGKTQGADEALNKPTYVSLLGLTGAREKADQLIKDALLTLEQLPGNTQTLAAIATYITDRRH